MTPSPRTLTSSASIVEAARIMRDEDVGAVIVMDKDDIRGIVTDRDITVRCVADGQDWQNATLGSMCTGNVVTVSPDDDVQTATRLMRDNAVRRLPVVENGKPGGIVSIGDLSIESDGEKALADISAAPPNN
jgi:CBS domain-containing protein